MNDTVGALNVSLDNVSVVYHANLSKTYGADKATAIVTALKKAYPQKKIQTLSYICSGTPGLNGLGMRNNVVKMARLKHGSQLTLLPFREVP